MALGNTLNAVRIARGETLRQVAGAVGMDPTHLSKLERGMVGCSDELKLALAQHFGVPLTDLFFQTDVELSSSGTAR